MRIHFSCKMNRKPQNSSFKFEVINSIGHIHCSVFLSKISKIFRRNSLRFNFHVFALIADTCTNTRTHIPQYILQGEDVRWNVSIEISYCVSHTHTHKAIGEHSLQLIHSRRRTNSPQKKNIYIENLEVKLMQSIEISMVTFLVLKWRTAKKHTTSFESVDVNYSAYVCMHRAHKIQPSERNTMIKRQRRQRRHFHRLRHLKIW